MHATVNGKHCKQKLHVTRVLQLFSSLTSISESLLSLTLVYRDTRPHNSIACHEIRWNATFAGIHLAKRGGAERASGRQGGRWKVGRVSGAFIEPKRSERDIYIVYKRGSEHRGRNPNLITSGPPAVDSIFKMTGGRDGCDVTLRRRLKPY